jgi:hypothetical protein
MAARTGARHLAVSGAEDIAGVFSVVGDYLSATVEVTAAVPYAEPGEAYIELSWSWTVDGTVYAGEDVFTAGVLRADCATTAPIEAAASFRDQVAAAFCTTAEDAGSEIPLAHGSTLDLESCLEVDFLAGWYGETAEDLQARLDAGAVRLDEEKAQACVAALCSLPASDAVLGKFDWPEVCWQVFDGLVDEDGACETALDCSGEAVCDRTALGCAGSCQRAGAERVYDCDPQCQPGQVCAMSAIGPFCRTEGGEGESCLNLGECQPNLVCDYASRTCLRQSAVLPLRASCRPGVDSCIWPYRCVAPGSTAFACGSDVASGATCRAWSLDCGSGTYCAFDPGDSTGTCTAKKRDGSACQFDRECGAFCTLEKACASGPLADGALCRGDAECEGGVCGSFTGGVGTCSSRCPS